MATKSKITKRPAQIDNQPPGELLDASQDEGGKQRSLRVPDWLRVFWVFTERTRTSATKEVSRLLDSLELSAAEKKLLLADRRALKLLRGFCTDVHLNLAWYRPKVMRLVLFQRVMLGVVLSAAVAFIWWMVKTEGSAAELGVLAAGALATLQLLVTVSDRKAQLAAFRRAKAELTRLLLTFVETWQDDKDQIVIPKLDGTPGSTVNPQFLAALTLCRKRARAIVEAEEDAHFNAMKTPVDLLQIIAGGVESVRQRRVELDTERREARSAAQKDLSSDDLGALRSSMRELEAQVEMKTSAVEKLIIVSPAARPELAQARAELAEKQFELDEARRIHARAVDTLL
jgi:hypothetical protein